MAVMKITIKYVILSVLFVLTVVNGSKLNVPRVLLPVFNDISSKFTLEATEGGCYKWMTTRSDIIQLTLINENIELKCSSAVIVSTVTKEAARNIAVVLAEDVHTKQSLRCDVIVDVIHSISITTTTRELFMEEAPEDFEVKAFDDQGNVFSTLEGVEIEWNIIPLGPKKDAVLRYIKFADSPYETPPAVECMETQNKKGYSILLEGIKSGSAKVTARLPYEEYKNVLGCEVQLMVVANLIITPAEAYIMPGDSVPFKIFYLNNGRMEEVTIPDAQYYLETEDAKIASSIKTSNKITGLREGKTRIVLRDRNVGTNDPALKLPSATLYVANPASLVINILPHKNWAILVGDPHTIVVEAYSSNDHKLILGDNVQITTEIAPEFFVIQRASNGTWLTGHGMKPSVVSIQARLESIQNDKLGTFKFEKPIVTSGDLVIYPRISISPSEIILPWDPLTKPKYDIDLIVKGGDGRFIWTSSDHQVGVVTQTGHVRTHSNGFFEVSAAMLRNHHNRETAKFMILPPSKLEIIEFVMEAEVGSPVHLHVALYAEKIDKEGKAIQIPYTQCQDLPFQIRQSETRFRQNKTASVPPVGISCGNIAMVGLDVGTSKVTVTYYQDGKALEDSATVSAYNPLTLLEPKNDVVLAVGTSINLIYTGGPRPIIGKLKEHERIVVSENDNIVQAQDITEFNLVPGEDVTVINVLCMQLGETDIRLLVSNKPTASNCKSQSASITTRIICGKPRKISLQPDFLIAEDCPMDLNSGNVVVPNLKTIDIDVSVYDDCGNRFLNISSYQLKWTVEPTKAGKFINKDGTFPNNLTIGTIAVANKAFQTFVPSMDTKDIQLNVTLENYNNRILKSLGITAESPVFTDEADKGAKAPLITSSLSMLLVDEASLATTVITMYNHPGNKKLVPVSQGSGYFELALNNEDVANVKYLHCSKEIEVIPMKSGELTVQLLDMCLVSKPATLFVNIVSVGLIRVDMIDKVEVGKCIKCVVKLFDENDNLMDIPDRGMISVRPEFESKIANIQQDDEDANNPWGVGEVHFIVTGVEVGDTKLRFSIAGGDEDIQSAPLDLQVFNPLKIHPKNGTILVFSNLQYMVKGGPQPDANIEYIVTNPSRTSVLEVNEKGVATGVSIGTAKVLARAVGMHPTTGEKIIYSEDSVIMNVVPLFDIKIKAPLSRFQQGSTAPFWCFGMPNELSPLIMGSIENPPLIFKWEIKDNRVADLLSVVQSVGIDYKATDKVVIRVLGLKPGKTTLHLNVTASGIIVNKPNVETVQFSTSVDIDIILPFKFVRPKYLMGDTLLMAPYSEIPLQTNLDGTSIKILYTLPSTEVPSTELLADSSVVSKDKVVTVTPTGTLKSYGMLGHAMLIVIGTDEYGLKQRISVVVEVKQIHYMTLKVRTNWRVHSNTPLNYIPLGTELTIKATFHDNIGNKFVAGPLDLKIRSSRCDLIKITEGPEVTSVSISMIKPGITVVKVWAEGIRNTAGYIKLHVEQSVQPVLDDLTTGDIICLYAPVISQFNTPGVWRSSDSELVLINPALDIGYVGNREGVVVLTHSLLSAAPLQIQVLPISEIEFFPPTHLVLTNGELNTVLRIPLVLHSEKSVGMKTNNLIAGWRCRTDVRKLVRPDAFHCFAKLTNETTSLTHQDFFNVTSSFVPETGSYACKFLHLGIRTKESATLETDVLLWVKTSDGSKESEVLRIKFAPHVLVPEEVVIGDKGNIAEFDVVGLTSVLNQITVHPADPGILHVDEGTRIDSTTSRYKVQLLDYHWRLASLEDAMGIIVNSPITKQNVKIIVKVSGALAGTPYVMGGSPILTLLQNYKHAIAMALAMVVIFFLTFYFYSHYMQPVVNVNVNPNQSSSPRFSPQPLNFPRRCAANMSSNLYGNVSNRCAANMSAQYSPNTSNSPNRCGANASLQNSPVCNKANCSCCGSNNEPVYGDTSSFYTSSPEVRRNRRGM